MFIIDFFKRLFGSRNERELRRMGKTVDKINALEPTYKALSDDALRAKTDEFRSRFKAGESLDSLLPEAFAAVREASVRVLGMRPFDVQLIGGMALHEGKISEMRTGEGKTLSATLPTYLNALTGRGVHIVTVNDYLAKRDAEWMGPVYHFLGMTTGTILNPMRQAERQKGYNADITFGTNNEFGFDYLRDNMAFSPEEKVQRDLHFAVVDEVDSILIDEARTPLIISGPSDESSDLYYRIDKLIPHLIRQEQEDGPGDYSLDEKSRQAFLTEAGHQHVEELMLKDGLFQEGESLYDAAHISLIHHLYAALRAHTLFHRDVDYIVQNDQIVIVDEHTGRTMQGRRWSEGLHQAVEAKERVTVQKENQTLASITFQNYFRLFNKLSGMTGTADTEAYEFQQIYGLEVIVIPTNVPMVRQDFSDQVYLTADEKFNAIITDIKNCMQRRQPVLVGTASIETSEYLSNLLKKVGITHQVLNAKFHEQEAKIIAEAGRPGTVTIATNMAGRGTDIVLGGKLSADIAAITDPAANNETGIQGPTLEQIAAVKTEWQKRHDEVLVAGGLHIIGSERHESRRIDNQLRGRSGRQGDPGSTRFYLSLEDNLMRIFAAERVSMIMQKLGMKQGEAIEHPWVSKAIANAQRKVEARNFDIRKQLLEFDDVANDQRKVIYTQRNELMATEDMSETIKNIRHDVVNHVIDTFVPQRSLEEQWDVPGLEQQLEHEFGFKIPVHEWLETDEQLHEENLRDRILKIITEHYEQKELQAGFAVMRQLEKAVMLRNLDYFWKEHLAAMDHLRQGIHLRGYAAKNPKQEYKRESFQLFSTMLEKIKHDVVTILSKVQIQAEQDIQAMEQRQREAAEAQARVLQFQHAPAQATMPLPDEVFEPALMGDDEAYEGAESDQRQMAARQQGDVVVPFVRNEPKVGRNDPCPCGSGKKYKMCHGRIE